MVEIFAACLTRSEPRTCRQPLLRHGRRPPGTGQFFLAVSPEATSGGLFTSNLETVASAFVGDARLPGTRRFGAREHNTRDGIEVAAETLATLEKLAGIAA
ncbi:hypothetical protein ACVOMV_21975 [Mesorhizobium atlanticum]